MLIDTTKMSSRGQVVIPLDMRKDILEGDRLVIMRKDDTIILKRSISETALLSERSLARAWLSQEDEEAFAYLQKK